MTQTTPPLTPMSLDVLLGRVAHEWATRSRIFDLPTARFFDVSSGPDLSIDFMGRKAATPIGPAAGPHSQLAENIVLGWLGGGRVFELKTVQIMDELEINRPCIDMQTIGFNIEWSQELRIAQSLTEYVKAWMMIHMLGSWGELEPHLGTDPGPHIFDLSVGYDLAGISSEGVAGFIDGLMDASSEIDRLRPDIPAPFDAWRDAAFPTRIADTVTLSTFHGCPPHEIESITKHLMTRHGLDVVVKLNPTLLGFDQVRHIVVDELGYDEIRLRPSDFDADLQFDRGVELIGELRAFAAAHGRRFGIKLTNTLVVENHKGFMADPTMYLSGAPLHVVSMTLLGALARALPGVLATEDGDVQVSWSAGIDKENLPDAAALGLAPITICSDLLKPGGYGRLKPMLQHLQRELVAAGCADLSAWRSHVKAGAGEAVGPVDAYIARLHDPNANGAYRRDGNAKLPRQVDSVLQMWGCVACNFCVTVCPNDAFFRLPTPDDMEVTGRQQYFLLAELCNECGNCLVFCPEEGDPAMIKPRLFTDRDRFVASTPPGFLLELTGGRILTVPGTGLEGEVERLEAVLNAPEGLPLHGGSLPGGTP